MAIIKGTKGTYDTGDGFSTKRESATGEIQIVDSNGNIVDSEVDDNKASNRASKGFKAKETFNKIVQSPAVDAAKKGLGAVGQVAGALAQIGLKGAKSNIQDPMAGHTARQAALAENQAAKVRAQQQQANQIANRTSTTTGAMNEAQKVSEQAALQKQRLAAQQMAGDAGLANAAAAKAGAEVDPSQHFSEMQSLGSQERQRAVQLGQEAADMAAAAEGIRAKGTERLDQRQQAAEWNAEAAAANENAATRQGRQDALHESLVNSQIAKNRAESQKAGAEAGKQNVETNKITSEQSQGLTEQIRAMLKNPAAIDPKTLMDRYVSLWKTDVNASNQVMKEIAQAIGKDTNLKDKGKAAYDYWVAGPGATATDSGKKWIEDLLVSDKRMKSIETPIGHALMGIWRGRTM